MGDRKDRTREAYEEQDLYEEDGTYDEDPEAYDEQSDEDGEEAYDEDVFSLEEDLRREHTKQWIQYLLFAVCAAAVVGLALYGSILLTHQRLEAQKSAPVVTSSTTPEPGQSPQIGAAVATPEPAPVNYWPAALFPTVPVLDSEAYETTVSEGYAQVIVPSATAKNFDGYIDRLVEAGASVHVRTARLSVLVLDGVEIHLASNNAQSKVVLCGETAVAWDDSAYASFPLPSAGRLVAVDEGIGAGSRVLTYRLATTLDALAYTGELMDQGYTISGGLEPTNNIFSAAFKKNNLQITVDYFSSGDNYLVKLDYLG